jgi:hypothetical protein
MVDKIAPETTPETDVEWDVFVSHAGDDKDDFVRPLAQGLEAMLIAAEGQHDPSDAVLRRNVLGKPSLRARQAALYRLRQLYGLDLSAPICRALIALWARCLSTTSPSCFGESRSV